MNANSVMSVAVETPQTKGTATTKTAKSAGKSAKGSKNSFDDVLDHAQGQADETVKDDSLTSILAAAEQGGQSSQQQPQSQSQDQPAVNEAESSEVIAADAQAAVVELSSEAMTQVTAAAAEQMQTANLQSLIPQSPAQAENSQKFLAMLSGMHIAGDESQSAVQTNDSSSITTTDGKQTAFSGQVNGIENLATMMPAGNFSVRQPQAGGTEVHNAGVMPQNGDATAVPNAGLMADSTQPAELVSAAVLNQNDAAQGLASATAKTAADMSQLVSAPVEVVSTASEKPADNQEVVSVADQLSETVATKPTDMMPAAGAQPAVENAAKDSPAVQAVAEQASSTMSVADDSAVTQPAVNNAMQEAPAVQNTAVQPTGAMSVAGESATAQPAANGAAQEIPVAAAAAGQPVIQQPQSDVSQPLTDTTDDAPGQGQAPVASVALNVQDETQTGTGGSSDGQTEHDSDLEAAGADRTSAAEAPTGTSHAAGVTFQQNLDKAQSAAAGQTQPAQPEDYDIPKQIVDQARLIRRGENTEMVMHLKPEHLGDLTLRVSVSENGAVTASFHSDNAQVRNIIENSLATLRQELSNQGLKVDSVEVYAGLADGQLPQEQGQQAWDQQGQRHQYRSSGLGAEEYEEDDFSLAAALTGQNQSTTDGVDYRV